LRLVALRHRVVAEGIAGVDLHQIVDRQQGEDVTEIDVMGEVVLEEQGKERRVPGMIGVGFPPRSGREITGPLDRLELVGDLEEGQDAFEARRVIHPNSLCQARCPHGAS
jgi:hypothetical protein